MREATRPVHRVCLVAAFAAAMLAIGCAKKATPPPPPPPPPPPAARPTVTLQANPTAMKKGESSTLTWSSTNATQLTIAPDVGAVAPEGNTTVSPSDSTTYTVTASGPGGSADASVRVTVEAPPPPPPPPAEKTWQELFTQEVQDAYFDYDKADIRPDAREALGKTADFLRKYPEAKVTIEGHCDERGSTEYNLALGDRRAHAVKEYLVSLGISADRMNTISYGKEKPFCDEHNEACWQQNRRGHFIPQQ
ncbi:MAG TPA: peptidoglycan-associated lipoprotein Pal [Terriglobales bacterium]|nr:peptidoglycan-associated lipoprotein Pal [Terriglobales bacterium]